MKSSLLAGSLVGLAFVGLWVIGGGARSTGSDRARGTPRSADSLARENLSVHLYEPDAVGDMEVWNLPEALDGVTEAAQAHHGRNSDRTH
ncbi:MAG: hypothetical protein L0241_15590 [Planctomycetia bacterium]|nr:hypothetical protein [Planctomycetia bacterium]